MPDWLIVRRGNAPLILGLPHTGTEIPPDIEPRFVSPWLARKDADWWIDRLYDFAAGLNATLVRTTISRSVIDVNRDPSGASLYPGQATTDLCPLTTFDGEPLYRDGGEPDAEEVERRRLYWFQPYHAALTAEIARLRARHPAVILYDCHSIRSRIPRLFEGELPQFNVGTNEGATCAAELSDTILAICAGTGLPSVLNGRFKGGYTTRHYGQPQGGVHAVQMELACRGYLREPLQAPTELDWPPPFDPDFARPIAATLDTILQSCLTWALNQR
jgi:formiminoglutamase